MNQQKHVFLSSLTITMAFYDNTHSYYIICIWYYLIALFDSFVVLWYMTFFDSIWCLMSTLDQTKPWFINYGRTPPLVIIWYLNGTLYIKQPLGRLGWYHSTITSTYFPVEDVNTLGSDSTTQRRSFNDRGLLDGFRCSASGLDLKGPLYQWSHVPFKSQNLAALFF